MEGNKALIPISIIIAGVIVAGGVFISNRSSGPTPPTPNTDGETVDIPKVTAEDHILGNPNAQLVIVEYSDLECPFCKNFHETLGQIMDEYGTDGRVAWVYRHFPLAQLHSKAPIEAHASECVAELGGDQAFWDFVDLVFDITPSNNGLDLSTLPELAVQIGVDEEAFEECMNSGRYENLVDQQYNDALAAGGTGTPFSVIIARTGQVVPISGAQPYATIKATVDTLLGE